MKVTVTAWIHAHPDPYALPGQLPIKLQCWGTDMSTCGYALLETRDLEIELPDDGRRVVEKVFGKAVEAMEEQIAKVQEKADQEISSIREDIAKLCALTYTPPSGEGA